MCSSDLHSRSLSALLSFKTQMPFDRLPVWKELRALPLAEQRRRLHDPELRRRLIEASGASDGRRPVGAEARAADYDWLLVFDTVEGPHRTVAEVARERGQHPAETMIDLALARDLDLFFLQPVANEDQDYALELMRHPRAVVTFSDLGRTSRSSWTRRCRRTCSITGCAANRRSPSSRRCGC